MANILVRSLRIRWNSVVAECLGMMLILLTLWALYGIGVYLGVPITQPITVAWAIMSTLLTLAIIGAFAPGDAELGTYGRDDFIYDIYDTYLRTVGNWLGFTVVVCVICLGVAKVFF